MHISGKRKKVAVLAAAIIGLICVITYFLRPLSRDDVATKTARALERGDVDTLLNLTLPEERTKLGLNRDRVRAFLTQTLWARGFPRELSLTRSEQWPVDEVLYSASPSAGDSTGMHYPLSIMVTESPTKGWHLALGYLLFSSVAVSEGKENIMTLRPHFDAIAAKNGILGLRTNVNGYMMSSNP
jgi:hypothetical protein